MSKYLNDRPGRHFDLIESDFPPEYIQPFILQSSEGSHINDVTRDAIVKAWNVSPPPPTQSLRERHKITLKWHLGFLLKTFKQYKFSAFKEFVLLLRMKKLEKSLYITGFGWLPSYFFKMKLKAAKDEKENRLVVR